MSLIERIHSRYAYDQRVHTLSIHLAELIPQKANVLDIGCGDGLIAHLIMQRRPDVKMTGVDVLLREKTFIPIEKVDGQVLPFADDSFDVAMFVDVLHHTNDPMVLLREAARVVRKAIVLKDHTRNGFFAGPTLRFMDYVGNAHHGIALPYNYWTQQRWLEAFNSLSLQRSIWKKDLKLYARPTHWLFDRSLHFVALLQVS